MNDSMQSNWGGISPPKDADGLIEVSSQLSATWTIASERTHSQGGDGSGCGARGNAVPPSAQTRSARSASAPLSELADIRKFSREINVKSSFHHALAAGGDGYGEVGSGLRRSLGRTRHGCAQLVHEPLSLLGSDSSCTSSTKPPPTPMLEAEGVGLGVGFESGCSWASRAATYNYITLGAPHTSRSGRSLLSITRKICNNSGCPISSRSEPSPLPLLPTPDAMGCTAREDALIIAGLDRLIGGSLEALLAQRQSSMAPETPTLLPRPTITLPTTPRQLFRSYTDAAQTVMNVMSGLKVRRGLEAAKIESSQSLHTTSVTDIFNQKETTAALIANPNRRRRHGALNLERRVLVQSPSWFRDIGATALQIDAMDLHPFLGLKVLRGEAAVVESRRTLARECDRDGSSRGHAATFDPPPSAVSTSALPFRVTLPKSDGASRSALAHVSVAAALAAAGQEYGAKAHGRPEPDSVLGSGNGIAKSDNGGDGGGPPWWTTTLAAVAASRIAETAIAAVLAHNIAEGKGEIPIATADRAVATSSAVHLSAATPSAFILPTPGAARKVHSILACVGVTPADAHDAGLALAEGLHGGAVEWRKRRFGACYSGGIPEGSGALRRPPIPLRHIPPPYANHEQGQLVPFARRSVAVADDAAAAARGAWETNAMVADALTLNGGTAAEIIAVAGKQMALTRAASTNDLLRQAVVQRPLSNSELRAPLSERKPQPLPPPLLLPGASILLPPISRPPPRAHGLYAERPPLPSYTSTTKMTTTMGASPRCHSASASLTARTPPLLPPPSVAQRPYYSPFVTVASTPSPMSLTPPSTSPTLAAWSRLTTLSAVTDPSPSLLLKQNDFLYNRPPGFGVPSCGIVVPFNNEPTVAPSAMQSASAALDAIIASMQKNFADAKASRSYYSSSSIAPFSIGVVPLPWPTTPLLMPVAGGGEGGIRTISTTHLVQGLVPSAPPLPVLAATSSVPRNNTRSKSTPKSMMARPMPPTPAYTLPLTAAHSTPRPVKNTRLSDLATASLLADEILADSGD